MSSIAACGVVAMRGIAESGAHGLSLVPEKHITDQGDE